MRRKEGGKRGRLLKVAQFFVVLMTDPDLGSGLPSSYCLRAKGKHGTVICGSLGLSLVASYHLFSLVFQQEEECQRILQPAEGVWRSERHGLNKKGAGGGAEAQY